MPKTAGSSFLVILKHIYGSRLQTIYKTEEGVARIWEEGLPEIPPGKDAIHGHFPATRSLVERYPKARLVAWVREPVARMISYYHFWKREKPHGNPRHDDFLARKYSLLEFARLDYMKAEMFEYFRRISVERFGFIGMVEYFDKDIRLLADQMGWTLPEIPLANVTPQKKRIDEAEKRELEEILSGEIAFYRKVKKMRGRM